MPDGKNGAKSPGEMPTFIVFGRFPNSKFDQAATFLKKDAEAAKKAALDAGLSCLDVQTEADRKMASALPQGVINTQGRFSLSPASPKVIAELARLSKATAGNAATSADTNCKAGTASPMISSDLWQQLKPGSLVLAAGFDESDNLTGWWEATILRIDDGEFLVRWRDEPSLPAASRSQEYIALLHPMMTNSSSPFQASVMQHISYAVELSSSINAYDINGRMLWTKPRFTHTRLAGYSPTCVTTEYHPPRGYRLVTIYDSRGRSIRTLFA